MEGDGGAMNGGGESDGGGCLELEREVESLEKEVWAWNVLNISTHDAIFFQKLFDTFNFLNLLHKILKDENTVFEKEWKNCQEE